MKNFWSLNRHFAIRFIAVSAFLMSVLVPAAIAAIDDEYDKFGREATDFLVQGNGKAFTETLDQKALLDSVFEGMSHDTKTIDELRTGLSIGLSQIGDVLVRNLENAQIKYLRSRFKDDLHTALVRIDFGEKGINYLDFVLRKDVDGNIKIVDWYDYSKGQYYTDSVRQAIVLLLPEETTLFEKLLGTRGLNQKEVDQFVKLGELMNQQKFAEWLELYDELPDKLQESRILLLTRILVSVAAGDEATYRIALKDLHEKMGDDPTLGLILIDYYYYEKDYASAQKVLDNLSEHIGGDAAIDALRANVYLISEDYSKSVKYAEKAIKADEDYEDAYWTLLSASVPDKKYDTAVNALDMLATKFGYEFYPEDIEEAEDYKAFVKSKAYKKWKEEQTSGEE
jgi:hypothetical protein